MNENHKHISGEYYAFFIIANMQVNKKEVTVNKHMPFNTSLIINTLNNDNFHLGRHFEMLRIFFCHLYLHIILLCSCSIHQSQHLLSGSFTRRMI